MVFSDEVIGSWSGLEMRLEREGRLAAWSAHEPDLVGYGSVSDLAAATRAGANKFVADRVVGALVRLGSLAGAGDGDAVLLVLHLLSPGALALATTFGELTPDPLGLVVGELAVQVRQAGEVGPRGGAMNRCYAYALLRRTRVALQRELRPHATAKRPDGADLLVEEIDPAWTTGVLDGRLRGSEVEDTTTLSEFIDWAYRRRVCEWADLELLVSSECLFTSGDVSGGRSAVAAAFGVHEATLRRRRARTVQALRGSVPEYLRWVAVA